MTGENGGIGAAVVVAVLTFIVSVGGSIYATGQGDGALGNRVSTLEQDVQDTERRSKERADKDDKRITAVETDLKETTEKLTDAVHAMETTAAGVTTRQGVFVEDIAEMKDAQGQMRMEQMEQKDLIVNNHMAVMRAINELRDEFRR